MELNSRSVAGFTFLYLICRRPEKNLILNIQLSNFPEAYFNLLKLICEENELIFKVFSVSNIILKKYQSQ